MENKNDDLLSKNELITKLLSISENIGRMVMSVNEAMTRFVASDAFANIVNFFHSLPNDIQETELFQCISSFKDKELSYEDINWLQERFGYITYAMAVDIIRKKTECTPLDIYILNIIDSTQISYREKIIVLLAHFEELVYQTMDYERKSKDKIKLVTSESTLNIHDMDMDSYKKILIAGIVFIIFSNTDKYEKPIDKRIPFRNNILHRGMLDYSDEEAQNTYELLVCFIAELTIVTTEQQCSNN